MTIDYVSVPFEVREEQPFVLAIQWLGHATAGSSAVALCVLAIAAVGLIALQGRLPVRRGAYVLLGCFVLLGAPMIAGAFLTLDHRNGTALPRPPAAEAAPLTRALPPANYDPYAGASLRRD